MAYPWTSTPQTTYPPAATSVSVTPSGTAWVSSAWVTLSASASADAFLTGVTYRTAAGVTNLYLEVDIGVGAAASEVVIGTIRGGVGTTNLGGEGLYASCPIWISGILSGVRIAARIRTGSTNTSPWFIAITTVPASYTGANVLTTAKPSKIYPPAAVNVNLTGGGSPWVWGSWTTITASTSTAVVLAALNVLMEGNHPTEFDIDIGTGAAGFETAITRIKAFGTNSGTGHIPLWNPLDHIGTSTRIAARTRTGNIPLYASLRPALALIYHEKPL